MPSVSVVHGDWGYYLNFVVTYSNGTIFDLTGYSATLKVGDPGSNTVLLTASCNVYNPTGGQCSYQMTQANSTLLQCQIYKCELEIKAGTSVTFTVPNLYLKVVTDMPAG